jgi:hypothetical protein
MASDDEERRVRLFSTRALRLAIVYSMISSGSPYSTG